MSLAPVSVIRTPGLVVDGKLLAYGRVPSKEEISGCLDGAKG
ncbi:MAG: thioredoxin family protein [Chloroflexota bacterium]